MTSHSSTPAWKIPWMEKPGRLESMESQSHMTEQLHVSAGMALHKSSQDVWVHWLSEPRSRGEKSRSQSLKEAWSYRGVSTFETDANTHPLGQYGDQREKSHWWSSSPSTCSSLNQLCPEMSMKWDPECAVLSGCSSHMSLLGWPSHGVSHALKHAFLI